MSYNLVRREYYPFRQLDITGSRALALWFFEQQRRRLGLTTGNPQFADCLWHSAKPEIHSAKALPSAALGKGHSAKN